MVWMEIIGWIGAVLVLSAYGLLAMKRLRSDSYLYHGINIIGSIALIFYGIWKHAGATVLVNTVWTLIGLLAVIGIWRVRLKQGE